MQEDIMRIVAAMAAGQAVLSLSLLITRPLKTSDIPLAIVFGAALLIAAPQPAALLFPSASPFLTAISLPAHLALAPALWIYVLALTSETPWRPHLAHAWQSLPAGLGVLTCLLVALLPATERDAMMIRGEVPASAFALSVGVFIFLLILLWIGQTLYYAWRILRRLTDYRRRLKDLFASNDRRDLTWISALTGVMALAWLLALIEMTASSAMNLTVVPAAWLHALGLLALWAFAVCGLRQKPGFEGRYLPEPEPASPAQKYQKSALGPEQAQRIAEKIEAAMHSDRLYLDPNLSLHKLAAHIAVAPNTISQTLNETIGESFFAYVNRWRVEAAQPLIRASDQTVLDIALEVGFNSKSAFYKAFRAVTGVTPIQYKASGT